MIYRGPGFLAVVWFSPSPQPILPPIPSVSQLSLFLIDFMWVAGQAYWRERGGGGGKSQIMRRRESLVLYKSLSTLWSPPPHPLTLIPISLSLMVSGYNWSIMHTQSAIIMTAFHSSRGDEGGRRGFNSASIGTLIAWNPGSGLVVCTLIPLKNVVMFLLPWRKRAGSILLQGRNYSCRISSGVPPILI